MGIGQRSSGLSRLEDSLAIAGNEHELGHVQLAGYALRVTDDGLWTEHVGCSCSWLLARTSDFEGFFWSSLANESLRFAWSCSHAVEGSFCARLNARFAVQNVADELRKFNCRLF